MNEMKVEAEVPVPAAEPDKLMYDLVELLRIDATYWGKQPTARGDLLIRAADEIERLRAQIASLAETLKGTGNFEDYPWVHVPDTERMK